MQSIPRDILFRAKSVKTGEWLEGYLVGTNMASYIWHGDSASDAIHPETVCQFTGRFDRSGKKIFEYDIKRDEYPVDNMLGVDERIYCVCIYIKEWSRFAWLTYGELIGYQSIGVSDFDESLQDSFGMFANEDSRTIIKGNSFDNYDLLLGKDGSELTAREDTEFLDEESARDVGEGRSESMEDEGSEYTSQI